MRNNNINMLRITIVLLFLTIPFVSYADGAYKSPIFGKYGFANQESYESFDQYKDKKVIYIPCKPLSYIEKNVFKTEKFIPGAEYIITDLSIKKGRPFDYIAINLIEKDGNLTLKMKSPVDEAYQLPFFFIDVFDADKSHIIGKKYKDPLVKGEYTITDARLEDTYDGERIKEVIYYVINPAINRSFRTTDYETTIERFIEEDKSGFYHSTLVKVEKPENSFERYGNVKTIDDKGVTKYTFEDDYISIIIFAGDSHLNFKLDNKTMNSMKIVWDDAVFVDNNGSSSKIMHSGIKYNEKENPQVATTIIGGASLEDTVCPTSIVRYDSDQKEWIIDKLYPKSISKGVKQFRLMLPIQIKDVVNEYVFIFDVEYVYNHPERLNIE